MFDCFWVATFIGNVRPHFFFFPKVYSYKNNPISNTFFKNKIESLYLKLK